ncbi:MAG: hypothetical protein GY810_20960 [Aureispira sp.]|nr:hypothetical protein [Aureispira sp.]
MKPTTRFFLRIALVTGSFFGIGMAVLILLMFSFFLPIDSIIGYALVLGLLGGLLFGLFFSAIITYMQVSALKKMGETDLTEDMLSVVQKKLIRTPQTLDDLITKLENTEKFNRINIITPNKKIGVKGGLSWASWGEKVEITLTGKEGELNVFELMSRPSVKTTMADYGKNRKNVQELERILLGGNDLSEHLIG